MDNAFNMSVNGQYIFGSSDLEQVQFETASSLKINRNIQFADGSEYTIGGIDQIYNMKGTLNAPLLRIMISRSGEVTMLGSKTNGGPLFPLKLMGGSPSKGLSGIQRERTRSSLRRRSPEGRSSLVRVRGRKGFPVPRTH